MSERLRQALHQAREALLRAQSDAFHAGESSHDAPRLLRELYEQTYAAAQAAQTALEEPGVVLEYPSLRVRVSVQDLDSGDRETVEISDDYVLVCAGTCHLEYTRYWTSTRTHQLTIKGVRGHRRVRE